METWDAIRARRDVRSFSDRPIPEQDLLRIAEAAWRAPSGSNRQRWHFVVVTDADQLSALSQVAPGAAYLDGAAAAIAMVIPVTDDRHITLLDRYDIGQATFAMSVAATDLGIGAGHATVHDDDRTRDILGVDDDHIVPYLVALGYPADRPLRPIQRPNRLPFEDVVHRDRWQVRYETAATSPR